MFVLVLRGQGYYLYLVNTQRSENLDRLADARDLR